MNELSLFNSLFDDVFGGSNAAPAVLCRTGFTAPKVDVIEEDNAYTLEMELPGRTENDINIELDHDNLTIASKTEEEKEEKESKKDKKNKKYLLQERRTTSFTRRFSLPQDIDSDSIAASFKNGILTVTMKKKELAAPKQIAVIAG
ncbi:MAG: Hsp20/alpha crystallin family protein [Treponema sp.]|nr:Hsp20/alpha crystallin family protein [Treponema sp.]MBR1640687.1 Hsp20/alpha crystallin family protein [Treponema sp.]